MRIILRKHINKSCSNWKFFEPFKWYSNVDSPSNWLLYVSFCFNLSFILSVVKFLKIWKEILKLLFLWESLNLINHSLIFENLIKKKSKFMNNEWIWMTYFYCFNDDKSKSFMKIHEKPPLVLSRNKNWLQEDV